MARRRANGEGSISRRKDGRYEAALWVTTASGIRKRVRYYGSTRQEADAQLTQAKARADQGVPVPDRGWRLGDYLDYWLESIIRRYRRPTTYVRYESCIRIHLKPGLGVLQLSRLTVPTVQQFLARQLDAGKSLRTVQIMREVLRSSLSNAMREELLLRNVAAHTTIERRNDRREVKPWSADETQAFLTVAATDTYACAFLIQAVYGLRRGEVAGTRWGDVDFAGQTLSIRQQIQRVHRKLIVCPLKTRAGRRDLVLLGLVADHLRKRKPASATEDDLVFTNTTGGPLDPHQLYKHFVKICARNDLRPLRLHDLRHSLATLLKRLGVQPRDVQLILGHASVQTTQEIYQHADEDIQRAALQQVARLLMTASDRSGSRQLQPSTSKIQLFLQGSELAGDEGFEFDLGTDPTAMDGRFHSVKRWMEERTRQWLLGAVAVNLAVRTTPIIRPEGAACVAP